MSDQTADEQTPDEQTPDEQTPVDRGQPVDAENSDAPVPENDELEEPSTEKDLDEQPAAKQSDEPEPSHHAVGIGVIGGPQTIADTPEADGEDESQSP